MHASLVRRQLSGLVPPKIASPSILVSSPLQLHPPPFSFSYVSFVSRRGRVRTSAPSSRSTPSSQRALRLRRLGVESRRATSTARMPPRHPSSSPCWPFSDLGTPSIIRVRGPLTVDEFPCILIDFTFHCLLLSFDLVFFDLYSFQCI
jgi:hypothetical protein